MPTYGSMPWHKATDMAAKKIIIRNFSGLAQKCHNAMLRQNAMLILKPL